MSFETYQESGPRQAGARMVVGIFLFFLEVLMYFLLRPAIVVILDAIVGVNVSMMATFGQQIGFIVDGSWLCIVLLTLIFLVILPASNR